jgi:hypothetical protein
MARPRSVDVVAEPATVPDRTTKRALAWKSPEKGGGAAIKLGILEVPPFHFAA